MAFTAGIKRPQLGNTNAGNQQNSFDRLVTVLGYDTDKKTLFVEDDKGRKYETYISKEDFLKAEDSATAKKLDTSTIKWMGHDINKKMEKANPVGSKVILQKTKVIKKDNGEGYALTEASRIIGVPNPEADKTFQGVFSISHRMDEERNKRISRVRHWQPSRGIDINDDESIAELKKEIDEAVSHHETKVGEQNVTVPMLGIQMRALMKTDKINPQDNTPIYEAVDSTINFDWMREAGGDGQSKGHPMTGNEMLSLREGYIEYISNHEQFKSHVDDMKIEICVYRVYPASKNKNLQLTFGIESRDLNADKNPLYQLAHRQNFVDIEQTERVEGVNYAVNGIIQIAGNKPEKVNGKFVEVPNYWVNNIHANHIKGHVFAFIRTAEGHKVEVHPNLQLIREADHKNSNVNSGSNLNPSSGFDGAEKVLVQDTVSSQAPTKTQPAASDSDDSDFNPFESVVETPPAKAEASIPKAPIGVKFGKR